MTSTAPLVPVPHGARGVFSFGGDFLKIKRFVKRFSLVCSIVCVLLLCFIVTVAGASSTWSVYHTTLSGLFPEGFTTENYELEMSMNYISTDGIYYLMPEEVHGDYGIQYRLPVISDTGTFYLEGRWRGLDCSVSAGDVFNIKTWLYGWSNRVYFSNNFTAYFIVYVTLPDGGFQTYVTEEIQLPLNTDGNFSKDVDTSVSIGETGVVERIQIVFKGYRTIAEQGRFRYWLRGGVDFSYGNPNSPDAPKYSAPSSGDLSELEALENQLESDSSEGLDQATDSFMDLPNQLLGMASGLMLTSKIMLSAITKIPLLNVLVQVSLALGLMGTLLALSASIISASDRRASQSAKRSKKKSS